MCIAVLLRLSLSKDVTIEIFICLLPEKSFECDAVGAVATNLGGFPGISNCLISENR